VTYITITRDLERLVLLYFRYVPLQACIHRVPVDKTERGGKWPEPWPRRLNKPPYWLNNSQTGIYGKPPAQDFAADTNRWKNVVEELTNIGITWTNVRNVMDMRSIYGGYSFYLGYNNSTLSYI